MTHSFDTKGTIHDMERDARYAPGAQDLLAPVKALFDEAIHTLRRLPPAERPMRARVSWDGSTGQPAGVWPPAGGWRRVPPRYRVWTWRWRSA